MSRTRRRWKHHPAKFPDSPTKQMLRQKSKPWGRKGSERERTVDEFELEEA